MLFLNIKDLSVFFYEISSMPPMFNAFFILVPFLPIPPLPKKSKVIGLQLRSSHSKNNFEDQNKLL